jgi:serine/threonine protein kinase
VIYHDPVKGRRFGSTTASSPAPTVGIMGYELLTLKTPHEGTTSVQLVTAHLKKEPIPLARLRLDVDPRLAELLERCLSKNPWHRARASEVAKALEQVTEEASATGASVQSDTFRPLLDAAQHIPALEAFIGEFKRRHVFNVAVFYVLVTAGLLQFAQPILESLLLPDNSMRILVALTLGGGVILVLSWMFDVSTRGIQRTESEVSEAARIKLRFLQTLGLALSLLLAVLVGWWILSS